MQAKAVPLVCDSHFFYLFQIQRRRALNTHTKKKTYKKNVKDYGTTLYGSLARCHNLNRLVENTLHNHTHGPQKNGITLSPASHSIGSRQQQGKKNNIQWPKQEQLRKPWEFWQCFYFNTRKQHVRWLSISTCITLTPPVYIYIYIYRVPHIAWTKL